MPLALYGKLIARRDFIARGVPRGFLDVFEPWLQAAMAASRQALGARWQSAYFGAPIWRFWLGEGHCGRALMGVLMPSVDGVGRCFPLTAFAVAPEQCVFRPPQAEPQASWFEAMETFVLSTLEIQDFTQVLSGFVALSEPRNRPRPIMPRGVIGLAGDVACVTGEGEFDLLDRLAAVEDNLGLHSGCRWWTVGGGGYPPVALSARALPGAESFAAFLDPRLLPVRDAAGTS